MTHTSAALALIFVLTIGSASGLAVLTEYFDQIDVKGDKWLIVTQMIDDPQYLAGTFVVSSNFKKEPDASKWNPTPCSVR